MKEKLTPKKPENKSVPGTEALQKSNFIKIAKRAKVWLNAMNEAAKVQPKQVSVNRAADFAEWIISKDYLRSIKQKFRAPHIMDADEVDDFLEMLAEMLYESVGKKRTAVWELDQIY